MVVSNAPVAFVAITSLQHTASTSPYGDIAIVGFVAFMFVVAAYFAVVGKPSNRVGSHESDHDVGSDK